MMDGRITLETLDFRLSLEMHAFFLAPITYLESLMTTLLALLTNLLVSEMCRAGESGQGENAVNQVVLGSLWDEIPPEHSTWIATNKMSAIQIEEMAAAIASKSVATWEFIIETNLSLFAMQSNPEYGSLNSQTFKAILMVYTMPHPTNVYYRRPHVGIIALTAQDHHCHTLR